MARTGTLQRSKLAWELHPIEPPRRRKISTLKQQRANAQLELIIEKFAYNMRSAASRCILQEPECKHGNKYNLTMAMHETWEEYKEFLRYHPQ